MYYFYENLWSIYDCVKAFRKELGLDDTFRKHDHAGPAKIKIRRKNRKRGKQK